jgi:hypothetical protein
MGLLSISASIRDHLDRRKRSERLKSDYHHEMRIAVASALVVAACGAPQAPAAGPAQIPKQPPASRDAAAPSLPVAATPAPAPPTPFLRGVVQLSVGHTHVCALAANHEVVCWGDNAAGQLGVGTDGRAVGANLARPHVVGGLPPIASVAAGAMHTCAIARSGEVFCWGSAGGDLVKSRGGATGSIELRGAALGRPVTMPLGAGEAHLVALSSQGSSACAAFTDEVRCWSTFQTIPINATAIDPPNVTITKIAGVSALALGHGKVCAIARDQLSCWRENGSPTPAMRARGDSSVPSKIAIGQMYACVAGATGELRCWWSLIDDFWKKPPNRDVRWPGKTPTRAVAVGDSPICTADRDGRIDCFLADEGGLPDQAAARSWATKELGPYPIAGVEGAVEVGLGLGRNAMGYGFGCARREAPDPGGAEVLCWGDNESGQLGSGDQSRSRAAVRVVGAIRR